MYLLLVGKRHVPRVERNPDLQITLGRRFEMFEVNGTLECVLFSVHVHVPLNILY